MRRASLCVQKISSTAKHRRRYEVINQTSLYKFTAHDLIVICVVSNIENNSRYLLLHKT